MHVPLFQPYETKRPGTSRDINEPNMGQLSIYFITGFLLTWSAIYPLLWKAWGTDKDRSKFSVLWNNKKSLVQETPQESRRAILPVHIDPGTDGRK